MRQRSLKHLIAFVLIATMTVLIFPGHVLAFATTTPSATTTSSAKTISAYEGTTFFIDAKNALYGFGDNGMGQIGDGTQKQRLKPLKVLENVKAIYQDGYTTYALRRDNTLWAWGENTLGQVGNGTEKTVLKPVKILDQVRYFVATSGMCNAIKLDNSLWGWGYNSEGQVGNGNNQKVLKPYKVADNVKIFYQSRDYNMYLSTKNELWGWNTWGAGAEGAVPYLLHTGVKAAYQKQGPDYFFIDQNKVLWGSPESVSIEYVENYEVSLNLGKSPDETTGLIKLMDQAESLVYEFGTLYVLKTDKSLWGWGLNDLGQLGRNAPAIQKDAVKILDKVKEIKTVPGSVMALSTSNQLWVFGDNTNARLGNGQVKDEPIKKPTKILDNVKFFELTNSNSYAVTTDGKLFTWGTNILMSLGNSNDAQHMVGKPTKIMDKVHSVSRFVTIGIPVHTIVLKQDGTIWTWGRNNFGELGNGTTKRTSKPQKVFTTALVPK